MRVALHSIIYLFRDAIIIPLINCGTSFIAGFAIFSIIGFMATQANVAVEDVITSGQNQPLFRTHNVFVLAITSTLFMGRITVFCYPSFVKSERIDSRYKSL